MDLSPVLLFGVVIVLIWLFNSLNVLREYERGVIFRIGRLFHEPKGPGLIWVFFPIDRIVRVSLRTITMDVPTQDVITSDNVSVKVNAVVYFRVVDPLRAIVDVENYLYATSQLAQTTLRSVLGEVALDDLLSQREKLNLRLQESLIRGLGDSGRIGDAVSRAALIADQCAAAGDRLGELRGRLAGLMWQASLDPKRWLAESRALVAEARPVIEQNGDAAARAALEHAAGHVDFVQCRNAAAFAEYTSAMEHARRAGDRWLEASLRERAASALVLGPTPRNQALRWLEDAEAQSATYQPWLKLSRATIQAELGHFGEAAALMSPSAALSRRTFGELPAGVPYMPLRIGSRPVSSAARLGEHTGWT